MKTFLSKIESFFFNNTVWIFVTAIFFISFDWVMTLRFGDVGYVVYLASPKWYLYLRFSASLLVIFFPVLLFLGFKEWLKRVLDKRLFWFVWIYSFILHPVLMMAVEIQTFFPALTFPSEVLVLAVGFPLLFVELVIIGNDYFKQKNQVIKWLQAMQLEKALIWMMSIGVFFMALLATYLIEKEGNNEYPFIISLLFHFAQLYIFLLLIYSFYWLNHYVLVKKLLKEKGFIFYLSGFILLGLIFYPIFSLAIYYFPMITIGEWKSGPQFWIPKGERQTAFSAVLSYVPWLYMIFSIPFILVYQWWKQKNDITQLQKEKSTAELNALKQQINPHFLFNTLNSLYALGIKEKGEKTADGIAKLGTLMRYNLNDAQKELIPLSKEIDYINNYIELQKLRLTDNNQLTVSVLGNDVADYNIAPLLLIPFIENAFKFGVSSTEKTKIDLKINLENDKLIMHLFNTIIKNRREKDGNGIGISNTRKRLAKIYPKQYKLIIEETANEFEVHLEIDLK